MVNPYHVLDVPNTATLEEIKKRYRALALQYHPDRAGPSGSEKFKEIQAAYEILSDPGRRERYDRYGSLGENIGNEGVLSSTGSVVVVLMIALSCFLVTIFAGFLASYCDGNLTGNWNFVKVFSPLFVIDVLCILLVFLLCAVLSPMIMWIMLSVLSGIVLTVLIPIAKDRNDARSSDFLSWRLWLIPGYVLAVSTIFALLTFRIAEELQLQNFASVFSVFIRTIGSIGLLLLVILVALRADELITCSFFVVIGLPTYLCFGMDIIAGLIEVWMGTCFYHSKPKYLGTMLGRFFMSYFWEFLVIISASLLCKRLDDFYSRGTHQGTYSLATCLIPIFILLGFLDVATLLSVLIFLCCNPFRDQSEGNTVDRESVAESENEHVSVEVVNEASQMEDRHEEPTSNPHSNAADVD